MVAEIKNYKEIQKEILERKKKRTEIKTTFNGLGEDIISKL